MSKISTSLAVMLCLLSAVTAFGQDSTYNFTVQTLGGYTTPGVVPFWLRSNQFGSIPLDGASFSLIGAARKDYDLSDDKLFDWGASFEGRANLGQGSNLTLIEGYGKVRLGIFELRAGRSKEMIGLCDTTLSLGSFSVSGNSLGIPKITFSIPEYFTIPWFNEIVSVKGSFSHGWFGDVAVLSNSAEELEIIQNKTFLHQKSFYGRFGKSFWKLKLYGGVNHQVQWGNEREIYNEDYLLSPFSNYLYVITGKRYTNGVISYTRIGNHLGSVDLGIEYRFKKVKLLLYRQNFYETGNLSHLANIQDGLYGILLENRGDNSSLIIWDKFLFEFLYTKNQAGEPWSPATSSPYEAYYNHGQYVHGWSYLGRSLGLSLLSTRNDVREELPSESTEYFINNRVVAFHLACKGSMRKMNFSLKVSWSNNFGTYFTTNEEQSTDIINPGANGLFGEQKQLSTYFDLNREFGNGFNLGLIGGLDSGTLLYNSFGLMIRAAYNIVL